MDDCMAQERAKKHLRVQAGTSGGNVPMPGGHLTSHAWFSLPDGKRGIRRELSFFFFW